MAFLVDVFITYSKIYYLDSAATNFASVPFVESQVSPRTDKNVLPGDFFENRRSFGQRFDVLAVSRNLDHGAK